MYRYTKVREVLALDMRTVRERQAPPEKKRFAVYHVILCDVEVDYTVGSSLYLQCGCPPGV